VNDENKQEFQKLLIVREKKEAEERKKHSNDEEENKYDMYDMKKWKMKQPKYGFKGRPIGVIKNTMNQGINSAMKKAQKDGKAKEETDTKTPIKKKNTMSYVDKKIDDKGKKNSSLVVG